ncbi:MAG: pentapeptide repeat-containing protein [Cyanobacteria bacterium P01_G01_bin.54]
MIALLTLILSWVLLLFPLPAQAGSSSLIRAFDDVVVTGKDFGGQTLQEAEFAGEDLKDANFSESDLRGTVFNGCRLEGANFQSADFSDGIAYLSNFKEADLRNMVLTEAMLLRSEFDDADIEGADFSYAVLDRLQQKKLCDRASGVNAITGVETRESLQCP